MKARDKDNLGSPSDQGNWMGGSISETTGPEVGLSCGEGGKKRIRITLYLFIFVVV